MAPHRWRHWNRDRWWMSADGSCEKLFDNPSTYCRSTQMTWHMHNAHGSQSNSAAALHICNHQSFSTISGRTVLSRYTVDSQWSLLKTDYLAHSSLLHDDQDDNAYTHESCTPLSIRASGTLRTHSKVCVRAAILIQYFVIKSFRNMCIRCEYQTRQNHEAEGGN